MSKLSIITINYNNRDGLQKTITSVIDQSFTNYEYIIIDGGSTDGSVDIIKQYADKITYWVSEPDKGIYNAMNKGILQAKGEYCLFLNSGDWFEKDILAQVFSENITEDIVYGDMIQVNAGKIVRTVNFPDRLSMSFFYISSLPHPSSFIKRKLFENSLYDESYKIISDWLFFVKKIIIENCSYRHIHLPVSYFDLSGESSQNPAHYEERELAMNSILQARIREDYDFLTLIRNLKIIPLVNDYQQGRGLKKWLAFFIIKGIILYNIIFNKK